MPDTSKRGWLCLSRFPGEAIVIDGGIVVKISDVRGQRVRLAIQAPTNVGVHREEVAAKIAEQHEALYRDIGGGG